MSIDKTTQDHDQVQANKGRLSFSLRSIAFSHFNEKARWALDYYRIPYVEYRSVPLCHMISMMPYKAKVRPAPGASPFVTPFLTGTPTSATSEASNEEKITFNDSTEILDFLSEQYAAPAGSKSSSAPANLYSDDAETKAKILALEERFDSMIGPHIRRYMYYELLLHSPSWVGRGLGQHGNVGKLQTGIWNVFFPLISYLLVKLIRINDESAARSKDILRREFEHISRVLESGAEGPAYLVGNQFSAADLTLSSLAALVVGVTQEDGYGAWVPPASQLRPEAQAFCEELRNTTAGKHILECYKLHRGEKAPGSSYGFNFFGLW